MNGNQIAEKYANTIIDDVLCNEINPSTKDKLIDTLKEYIQDIKDEGVVYSYYDVYINWDEPEIR